MITLRDGVASTTARSWTPRPCKFNIERHKTLQGSYRRGELRPVTSVDVVDPLTVRIRLAAPSRPCWRR